MLAFIDESGLPDPNDPTLRPVLAAVCIPEDVMRFLIQRMYTIKLDIFGHTISQNRKKALRLRN